MFRALRHRNYRIFFFGQSISLVGTWIQQIALGWLVYRMTGSAVLLGLVGFCSQIAALVLAPLAGVIADRHHRHHLIIITQGAAMLQAFALAALVLTHSITVWEILALSLLAGTINAFDIPVRQSFTVDMVDDRKDLSNAIALNSSMVNAGRLVGPMLGGLLIAAVGEGLCFLFNALSYVPVLASLLIMKVPRREKKAPHKPVWQELMEGTRYTFGFMPTRTILALLSVISLLAGGAQTLMPIFAKDVFHGGSSTLGMLMGASGLGSLIGAIFLASRPSVKGLGRVIVGACIAFGLGMMGMAFAPLWVAVFMMMLAGCGMIVQMASSNTILQNLVDEDKRGRVMSFYTMALIGVSPFGSLLAGTLAHHIGAGMVLFLQGVCAVVAGGCFAVYLPQIRALLRPVYVKKGVIQAPIE